MPRPIAAGHESRAGEERVRGRSPTTPRLLRGRLRIFGGPQ